MARRARYDIPWRAASPGTVARSKSASFQTSSWPMDRPPCGTRLAMRSGPAMLKIERIESVSGAATLRLEGRVIGPWVEELERSCERMLQTNARLTLDLSEVWFVDRQGVRLLRSLMDRDVKVLNPSSFVGELLKGEVGG